MFQCTNLKDIKQICLIDNYLCEYEHTNYCNECYFIRLTKKYSVQYKKSYHIDDVYICTKCLTIFHNSEIINKHITMFNNTKHTVKLSPCCEFKFLTLKQLIFTKW